jgi:hypothetical protein
VRLDLNEDAIRVRDLLRQRVDAYAARAARSPQVPPVSAVIVGYAFDQAGWVSVHFDARPDYHSDGGWTLHLRKDWVECPHWHAAFSASAHETVMITLVPAGEREAGPTQSHDARCQIFSAAIGHALRDVVLTAKRDRIFDPLPKRSPCLLEVHEFDGRWDWPWIEDPDGDDRL